MKIEVTLVLAALMSVAGCAPSTGDRSQPQAATAVASHDAQTPPARTAARPWLLHLPGIAGPRDIDRSLINGLTAGGVDAQTEMYDWTGGTGGLQALMAYTYNRQQAEKVAEKIVAAHRADPQRKIFLTAHSGGAAIVTWALEQLPEGVLVDRVLMLAPALSPGYDMTKALKHVRQVIDVFYSPNDGVVLGAGTKVFGTMDRVRCEAAGKVGFKKPDSADEGAYKKLINHPYKPEWNELYGNNGDHITPMSKSFARGLLAPLLGGLLHQAEATTRPTMQANRS